MIAYFETHAQLLILIVLAAIFIEILVYLLRNRNKRTGRQYETAWMEELSINGEDVCVLLQTSDQIPVYVSENAPAMFGFAQETIAADIHILEKLLEKEELRRVQKETAEWDHQEKLQIEVPYHAEGDDAVRYLRYTTAVTKDGQYYLLTFHDITEEQNVREGLKKQIIEVQAVDESKTVFLSKMSHEIRTPMNGMLGMISLAKIAIEKKDIAEVSECLGKAESLTQFLLSIINDILDMSRIESGKLELEHAKFDIYAMAEKLGTMFQSTIEDKGIHFDMQMQDFTARYVIGDELRITQVISNFLSNSSKFTPKGGTISLGFRQMDIVDGKMSLMIRVKDTGKGMTSEFLHRIFQPFEQEDSGIARKFGGSGLGMAIADNLVRNMGGHILIDSELGKGSEFTVFIELPVAEGSQEEQSVEEQNAEKIVLAGRRMLMAEDNDINAIVANKLLSTKGLIIERAVNGVEAVEKFTSHEPGYYEAILMDIHMPEMDGWEATKAIRQIDRADAALIPIIALSADAFVEDKRHSIEVGMNGHVSKPIDYKELEVTLQNCLSEVLQKQAAQIQ